jgi:hypothetical protein|nr:MAG TPA: hypothetical protein [Caudoviricetes sp.]
MTRTLYATALTAGILSGIHAALLWCAGLTAGELDISTALLWTVISAVCLASLRPIRWARKHGNHPGFHRR